MRKILPISTQPIVSCYNDESFRYNIIDQDSSYEGWIAMEYINLCMHNNVSLKTSHLKGYHSWPYVVPNLEETKIQRNFLKKYLNKVNIISLIVDTLTNDVYVYLFLDEFFIPNRFAYKKEQWVHDNLIIGFDTEKSAFYMLGYGISGLIEISEVSFEQFENGFRYLNEIHETLSDIFFMKPEMCTVDFDVRLFRTRLERYLNGSILNEGLTDFSFGYEVYTNLRNYYKQNLEEYDIRNAHKLLEHKKCLLRSLNFIKKQSLVEKHTLDLAIQGIEELVVKCEKIKKMTIKYNIYSVNHKKIKREYIKEVLVELADIKVEEKKCLESILKDIEG
ncbi:hypothetical protein IGI37_002895 [Enterococcus sp. AZ194]|uniref:hypothetical protein n=1 Tax=Enterococcus sp. AZ194 TaxID=2774629 RepID=UPI003F22C5D4